MAIGHDTVALEEYATSELIYELEHRQGFTIIDSSVKMFLDRLWEKQRLNQSCTKEIQDLLDFFNYRR